MPQRTVTYLIIGAGPAGLGAGFRLKDLGEHDFLILEKLDQCGGLAASFLDDAGFTWDIGGHVQFSHYEYFDKALDSVFKEDEWLHHQRCSGVWIEDRFVPYPFQNNIGSLSKETMWRCLQGLIETVQSPRTEKPINFGEWIAQSFGSGIAEVFMNPYNTKVWAYPPEELSYLWIGERVATVDLKKICENVLFERQDSSWGPNNTFRFPLHGGTGAIWRRIGDSLGKGTIRTNSEVAAINPSKRVVTLKSGEEIGYRHLLSTIPVSVLTRLVEGISSAVNTRASQLLYSSTNIVGLGLEGMLSPELADKCWIYFPEHKFPFYRMTVFSRYSPNNVPDISKHFSLMCELSSRPESPWEAEAAIEQTLKSLVDSNLISKNDKVVSRWFYFTPFGYPTPSCARDAILMDVIPKLEHLGVYSRGRFGGWKYEVSNQDHTFMQGVEWVDLVVHGRDEVTYRCDSPDDPNLSVLRRKRKNL